MATYNLRRFSHAEGLKAIACDHLLALLNPHKLYFDGRGLTLPPLSASDGFDYDRLIDVLMNSEQDRALAILAEPTEVIQAATPKREPPARTKEPEDHWRWRLRMAEEIAAQLDMKRFGVLAMYLFGSTKNATAGPGSDIDIILHIDGNEDQKNQLTSWLEGWSLCLSELNYWRTGVRTQGLLDVHLVTNEDIEKKTSYAVKIGAVTDPARKLLIGVSPT